VLTTGRKVSIAALAITAAGLAACGKSPSTDAAQQDLQRDLQLASATTMNLAGGQVDSALLVTMETQPRGVPQAAKTVKKGAGTRAVRSETPTVLATPDVDVAAVEESEEVQAENIAPSPEPTNEPVAVAPRPVPVIVQTGGTGDYGTGTNGGGVLGGGIGRGGVVIRGGGVDGDNCDLHRGGRGGIVMRGPVYTIPRTTVPRPTGVYTRPRDTGSSVTTTSRPTQSGVARGAGGIATSARGRIR